MTRSVILLVALVGCGGGTDPVPDSLAGTWDLASASCTSGPCDRVPYRQVELAATRAELLLETGTRTEVSADASGDCVTLGGFEDFRGRQVEPTALCLEQDAQLHGPVTRTFDDRLERWDLTFSRSEPAARGAR